jgi:hypothetical protein
MKTFIQFGFCCLACILISQASLGQRQRPRAAWGVPETYSNLALELETGDVGGMEVVLIKSYSRDWAAVVIADGTAGDPVLVPVKLDYPNIEFTLPEAAPYEGYGKFTGKITRQGMVLWNKGQRVGLLRRQCR